MVKPDWWPVRDDVIHTATGDWCEARCQAAEIAMALALIARIEEMEIGELHGPGNGEISLVIPVKQFEALKAEVACEGEGWAFLAEHGEYAEIEIVQEAK